MTQVLRHQSSTKQWEVTHLGDMKVVWVGTYSMCDILEKAWHQRLDTQADESVPSIFKGLANAKFRIDP